MTCMSVKAIAKTLVRFLSNTLNFVPLDNKKVYLICFDGRRWGYDQRALFDYIEKNYPHQYNFVWEYAKEPPDVNEIPEGIRLVKTGTLGQLIESKTAKYVVCNINPHDYINYRNEQVLVNTWHGFGIKGVNGVYGDDDLSRFATADIFCSHAEMQTKVFHSLAFRYRGEVMRCGAPRNDIFFDEIKCTLAAKRVFIRLGIPFDSKAVMYAPTFRNDFDDVNTGLDINMVLASFQSRFGGEWVLLYRGHPMTHSAGISSPDNAIHDVTTYPDPQELMCAASALISDYSGTMWDYSLTGKPVFIFAPDVDEYDRGLSIPFEILPYSIAYTNNQLEVNITNFNIEEYNSKLNYFYCHVGKYDSGHACEALFNEMLRVSKEGDAY